MTFPALEPAIVWHHFARLCAIPRPSKHEGALRDALVLWANERKLATLIDHVGNIVIRKPATPGMENRPVVTMQGHIDMVCQKNDGVEHDFFRDSIKPVLKDGWLIAENTTLGADNGIGVALALAALEDDTLAHGPLEVLLTIDEEAGMGGAQGLQPGLLHGELLINLDTEEWGEVYLGCAGGMDVHVSDDYQPEPLPAGLAAFTLTVKGLRGGHSGIDIHKERGHAIRASLRLLRQIEDEVMPFRLCSLIGGSSRNALTRECSAVIAFPPERAATLQSWLTAAQTLLRQELVGVDENISLLLTPTSLEKALPERAQSRLLRAFHAAPQGIQRWSLSVPGVVETSLNLGVIRIAEGKVSAALMLRSLLDSGAAALARQIQDLFELAGCQTKQVGRYPGWKPDPDSALLALTESVYQQTFGSTSQRQVIHAGLECGLIGAKYPAMDMVSFGPDIAGAHAPGESVNVESVEKCWQLLRALLTAIPAKIN